MGFFPRSFSVLLLLALGFGAGWGLRGFMPQADTRAGFPTQIPVQPPAASMAAGTDTLETDPQLSSSPPKAPQPATENFHEGRQELSAEDAGNHLREELGEKLSKEFRALLQAQSFDAAMNLYSDIERRSSRDAAELKELALAYLESCLDRGDGSALTGLVDAWLGRYYGDIEVLVLLARYQRISGYSAEAARTFQLAFTYAFTSADKQKVDLAFESFVGATDEHLAGQQSWRRLISFYETLGVLDLTRPHYQLRLAELYMAHGEPDFGRDLLTRLAGVPSVSAAATNLLHASRAEPKSPTVGQSSGAVDAIPLRVVGSHYALPLALNSAEDIHLIIDTGATTTTLSRKSFDALSRHGAFTELGPRMFNTAGGVTKGTLYRVASFQLGDQLLSDVDIAVLDFDMPVGVDGLLGMNVLRHFRFRVDQDEQRLYLRPR